MIQMIQFNQFSKKCPSTEPGQKELCKMLYHLPRRAAPCNSDQAGGGVFITTEIGGNIIGTFATLRDATSAFDQGSKR